MKKKLLLLLALIIILPMMMGAVWIPSPSQNAWGNPATLANLSYMGDSVTMTAGETIAIGKVCYVGTGGKLYLADADSSSTMVVRYLALASVSTNATGSFLKPGGYFRNNSWSWTAGAYLYASTTAGGMTATAPSGSGDVVQRVAEAITATVIEFVADDTDIELE